MSIKVVRGMTNCREYVNGERTCCSFTLPTNLKIYNSPVDYIKVNYYAKDIELKIGDIILSHWGQEYKVLGGDIIELMVEEIVK